MPRWRTPLGVIITTEVWFVEINRLTCNYRAEIYGVSLRHHLFRTCNPDWIFVPQQAVCVECAYETQVPVPKPVTRIGLGQPEVRSRCNSSYEDEGFENEPGVSHLQPDRPTSRGHASSSFYSNASDEEEIFQRGPGQQTKHHPLRSGHSPLALREASYTALEEAPGGKKAMKRPTYDGSSPLSVFLLYFAKWWRRKDTTTATVTELTTDLLPCLTWLAPKCLCFLRKQYK